MRSIPQRRQTDRYPAQLLHVLYRVGQQTCCEKEQDNPHHAEEDTIVETIAHAINQYTQTYSSKHTKCGTDEQQECVCLKGKSERENSRFYALSSHSAKC